MPPTDFLCNEEDKLLIEVQHVTGHYGKVIAVDDVSFKIRNGHVYGLVGPAGAGKTPVMHLMAGCIAPLAGTVLINGYDIQKNPMEAKRQIGYAPADAPLFPDMTPHEYLCFVAEAKGERDERLFRHVRDILHMTDLESVQHVLIRHLPEGARRRLNVAQTLTGNPDIILLDEPLEGLDPVRLGELRALIRKLGEKLTVVIAAPTLAELGGLCDHVIELSGGRVTADEDVVAPAPSEAPAEDAESEIDKEVTD